MNIPVESHQPDSRFGMSMAEFLKQLPGDLSLISTDDTEEESSCVVEQARVQLTVRFTMFGYELLGPSASHTGFQSVLTGGPCDEGSIYVSIRKQIAAFNQFPYLVGPLDAPGMGWKMMRNSLDGNQVLVRLCDWAYPGTLKALESMGFECECPVNGYWLAPASWDTDMVSEVLEPWIKFRSRRLCEQTLVHQLERAYAYSSGRNKNDQISLF